MKFNAPFAAVLAITSLLLAHPLRATEAPLKVCLVSGAAEYESDKSLAELQALLESKYGVQCSRALGADKGTGLPGIEALDHAAVMVVFARRVTLPADQLARVKKFCGTGGGVVGIRTASHAFQNWLAFDADILGGSYDGHWPKPEKSEIRIEDKSRGHAALEGVHPFAANCTLYKNAHLAADATLLLTAHGTEHTEPVAWARTVTNTRVFYTSLGTRDDFKNDDFIRMLVNAIFWSARREPPK